MWLVLSKCFVVFSYVLSKLMVLMLEAWEALNSLFVVWMNLSLLAYTRSWLLAQVALYGPSTNVYPPNKQICIGVPLTCVCRICNVDDFPVREDTRYYFNAQPFSEAHTDPSPQKHDYWSKYRCACHRGERTDQKS